MALTPITVTASYKNPDGSPAAGVVSFTPTASLVQAGVGIVTVAPKAVFVLFGAMSVVLYADDDSGTVPTGQGYNVIENFGPEVVEYSITLSHLTTPVDLSTLDHVTLDSVPRFGDSVTDEQFVRSQRLDQFATPAGAVPFGGQPISGLGAPTSNTGGAQAYGSLLAMTYYAPSSFQSQTINTTTLTALDTTNLTTGSFTAIGTQVLVTMESHVGFAGTPAVNDLVGFGLLDHTSHAQVGTMATVFTVQGAILYDGGHAACSVLVTGLASGSTYRFDWAGATTSSTAAVTAQACPTGSTFSTSHVGPAIMRVLAA